MKFQLPLKKAVYDKFLKRWNRSVVIAIELVLKMYSNTDHKCLCSLYTHFGCESCNKLSVSDTNVAIGLFDILLTGNQW